MQFRRTVLVGLAATISSVAADLPSSALAEASSAVGVILSIYGVTTVPAALQPSLQAFENAEATAFASIPDALQEYSSQIAEIATNSAARQSIEGELVTLYPGLFGKLLGSSSATGMATAPTASTSGASTATLSTATAGMISGMTNSPSSTSSKGAAPTAVIASGVLGAFGLAVAAVLQAP